MLFNIPRIGFHHRPAFFARAQILRIVKMPVVRLEILLDVVEFEVDFVQFVVAVVAKPEQPVGESFSGAFAFDDESD